VWSVLTRRRSSVVAIAAMLRAAWFRVWIPIMAKYLSLLLNVLAAPGAHLTYCYMIIRVQSRRQNGRGREFTTHLHLQPRISGGRLHISTPFICLYHFYIFYCCLDKVKNKYIQTSGGNYLKICKRMWNNIRIECVILLGCYSVSIIE